MNNTLIMTDAVSAYQTWYLVDIEARIESIMSGLMKHQVCTESVANKLHQDINQSIAKTLLMPGPTGESNELYTQGRGVVLMGDFIESRADTTALIVHLSVALMAGNSVILATDDPSLTAAIDLLRNELPKGLVQTVSIEDWMAMIEYPIAVATLVGEPIVQSATISALAESTGAIVSIVEDNGDIDSPMLNDPNLAYRYITECTRTINVTAVGGNATLLELSS